MRLEKFFHKTDWGLLGQAKRTAFVDKAKVKSGKVKVAPKVIYPKYSKHWQSMAHTIDCVYSEILNHGLNNGLSFLLFKFWGKKHSKLVENLHSYFVWYFSFTWCTG